MWTPLGPFSLHELDLDPRLSSALVEQMARVVEGLEGQAHKATEAEPTLVSGIYNSYSHPPHQKMWRDGKKIFFLGKEDTRILYVQEVGTRFVYYVPKK